MFALLSCFKYCFICAKYYFTLLFHRRSLDAFNYGARTADVLYLEGCKLIELSLDKFYFDKFQKGTRDTR